MTRKRPEARFDLTELQAVYVLDARLRSAPPEKWRCAKKQDDLSKENDDRGAARQRKNNGK